MSESLVIGIASHGGVSLEPNWLKAWHDRWRDAFPASETFAEALYLACCPDVKEQIERGFYRSGAEHWVKIGVVEDLLGRRPRFPKYCEGSYLEHNPDVAANVASGSQPSGYFHFLMWGCSEGRVGWSLPNQLPAATYDWPSLQAQLDSLAQRPLISVIVPVYDTEPRVLEWCIASVRRQVYPNWELCPADDGSARPDIRDILLRYARLDARIKPIFLEENRGISGALNAAISVATGSWIALLNDVDELTPDALLETASAVVADPGIEVIYSDEDRISAAGDSRYDPTFKPDWSPDLLRSTMYIGHLTLYRKSLISRVGGFRTEFDGAQDYDLAMRATEAAAKVHHIPKILYHWRAGSQSAAPDTANNGYAAARQKMALEGALLRTRTDGRVFPGSVAGTWRVCYAPPSPHPMVSIVIPTAGYTRTVCGRTFNLLQNCVQSLIASDCYDNFEIVVVDNNDLEPDILRWLNNLPQIRVVHFTKHLNISDKINFGVEAARGEYVLLLNDDIEVISSAFLYHMVGLASQPGVGAVGAKLLFPDGRIQHVGVLMTPMEPVHALLGEHASARGPCHTGQVVHNAIAVTGACLLVKRDLFCAVGGFDHALPVNYNDVDFCLKVREQGLRIVVDPSVKLYHFESASKQGTYSWELQKFSSRWPALRDPYFSPNFRQDRVYFEMRQSTETVIGDFRGYFQGRFRARQIELVKEPIRFSIISPVYNTPIRFLQELEASLFNQSYRNFECVVVDNGSTDPATLQWFERISRDPRVKTLRFDTKADVMEVYGAAFRAASGEYVVQVDSDDFLILDALALLANAIVKRGRPAVLYTDECKSNADSLLFSPFHKPDWDPVLFTNICYCRYLGCLRRDIAITVGCFEDRAANWSVDWDHYWRLHRAGHEPVHVPEITYARRIDPGSMSSVEHSDKPEAPQGRQDVLAEHLRQSEWGRSLEIVENELFPHEGMWRLKPKPDVRIEGCLILELTGRTESEAVAAVRDVAKIPAGMRLISMAGADDGEIERTRQIASELLGERSVCVMPAGDMAGALRRAVDGPGDLVAWIGRDTVPLLDGWLTETAGLLMGIGDAVLAAGRVVGPDNRLLWAGGFFGINGFLDSPDSGLTLGDSGYHGIVHDQRSVDGVPSVHWVARRHFLAQVIERMPAAFTPAVLVTALALRTAAEHKRVLYTPFNLMMTRAKVIRPAVPDAELRRALSTSVPITSRYYNAQLSRHPGLHWVPAYQIDEATTV